MTMKSKLTTSLAAILITLALHAAAAAATLSPKLTTQLPSLADSAKVGTVLVAFNTRSGLAESHLAVLRGVGITSGTTYPRLGMAAVVATAGQVRALAQSPAVRSVWDNERLYYFDYQARTLTGVERLKVDRTFQERNGGLRVSGAGDFSVLVIDSGIDATHADLKLGTKVIQNVQVLSGSDTADGITPATDGFTPVVVLENVPNTDQSVGHGTHCAGIVGGTGERSAGRYAGVAPGAKLVGAGLGAGLFVINAVGAWEWALANQDVYKIRVVSNSYGSFSEFQPDDPINVASRAAYDSGIVVVFAGANAGPTKDTYNRYAKAPWVIGVAAGTKEGGLASFSSRGVSADERLTDGDPLNDFNAPTITAPGTGREFASNASKFTSDYVAARSTSNVTANGLDADAELEPTMIPFYTQISGTSMATPYVAGVVALMLDADPTLTPDAVRQIITETATRMPGYADHEVGAGYVNAYAAVDKVFNRAKQYAAPSAFQFNAGFDVSVVEREPFHVDFNPASLPGPDSPNAVRFTVEPGINLLDVLARVDTLAGTGDGNLVGLVVHAPDGTTYSSGIQYPVIGAPTRGVVVKDPKPGSWAVEVRGARGLAAVPGVSAPTSGAASPGPVDGSIVQKRFDLAPVADIQGHAAQAEIETALKARRIDTFSDGTYRPDAQVTRGDFARSFFTNAPVRQSLGASPKFADVPADLAAIAEAMSANGSTLRDWDFLPGGVVPATSNSAFSPGSTLTRLELAVALVRALGLDAEARQAATAGYNVRHGGITLTDNAQIPLTLRPYVQFAIDRGLLEVYPAEVRQVAPGQFQVLPGPRVEPSAAVTRASLAAKLNLFAARFSAGN
jgi:serine protease AprX